jgi:hypothetical protein
MFAIDIFYEALGAGMMAGLYSTLTMIMIASNICWVAGGRLLFGRTEQLVPCDLKNGRAYASNSEVSSRRTDVRNAVNI